MLASYPGMRNPPIKKQHDQKWPARHKGKRHTISHLNNEACYSRRCLHIIVQKDMELHDQARNTDLKRDQVLSCMGQRVVRGLLSTAEKLVTESEGKATHS